MNAQIQQVALLKIRMLNRMNMFKEFLGAPVGTDMLILKNFSQKLQKIINKGAKHEFKQLIKGRQNQDMLDTLFDTSDASTFIRKGLYINSILYNGQRGIVILINHAQPVWFVIMHIDFQDDNATLYSVELHNFELLEKM